MTDPYWTERKALVAAVTASKGELPPAVRRAIVDRARRQPTATPIPQRLAPFVDLVAEKAASIEDEDVDALRGQLGEEAIFEAIVAAALGASLVRLERVDGLLGEEG